MPTRNENKTSTASLVPGIRLDLNPFAQRVGTARVIRNWTPEKLRMLRKAYSPPFQVAGSASRVWEITDYRYHRAASPETQLLTFRSDGKIYRRTAGSELEIFPAATGLTALNARPNPVVIENRLHFADNSNAYIYDGRSFRAWGIAAPGSAPTVSVQAGAGITAAGGMSASFTWVVLDEQGNRVHESTRSTASAFSAALSNQTFRVDITGITPPAGVTHWSAYVSELNGAATRRRAGTVPITTLQQNFTAFPAGTAIEEPVRNDPPKASAIMWQWRNRIAMPDPDNPRSIWFTAYGEVKGTAAGAADESVCGRSASSLSDLVNEFRVPDKRVRLGFEHENISLVFSETEGYAIVGTGGIIDDLGTRSMSSEHLFTEGAAGSSAGCTTPYGAAWMTPGRKIWLWVGGSTRLDIGQPIQPQLNTIPEGSLADTAFFWWDGNGRKWLMVCCDCADSDNLTGSTSWRILVYDFDQASESNRPGEWFEITDHPYTVCSDYLDGEQRFLLAGATDGNIYQLDTVPQPAHLNRSMVLGKTYAGAAIQDNPIPILRTGLVVPNDDRYATGRYISIVRGTQTGPSTSLGGTPTVRAAVNNINPDAQPPIDLTVGTVRPTGEYLAWLKPEAGGTEGGALAKQFQFEVSYAAGSSNNGESDGRTTMVLDGLYKLAFDWQVQGDLK